MTSKYDPDLIARIASRFPVTLHEIKNKHPDSNFRNHMKWHAQAAVYWAEAILDRSYHGHMKPLQDPNEVFFSEEDSVIE